MFVFRSKVKVNIPNTDFQERKAFCMNKNDTTQSFYRCCLDLQFKTEQAKFNKYL